MNALVYAFGFGVLDHKDDGLDRVIDRLRVGELLGRG
jgi:hypothetical protein